MSVRAYRVNKKELADGCSFNCWHDIGILDFFLENEFWDCRNDDGCGSIEVPMPTLEKLLSEYTWDSGSDYRRDAIAADIAWAKEHLHSTVEYDCF